MLPDSSQFILPHVLDCHFLYFDCDMPTDGVDPVPLTIYYILLRWCLFAPTQLKLTTNSP